MSELEEFRKSVEAFITDRETTATAFGKQFAGDPRFVFQLREGREPRSDTRAKIKTAMKAAEAVPV